MPLSAIIGSWSGTVALDPSAPTLIALDADPSWFTGSLPEWDWNGPESTPMPYPPTPGTGFVQNALIFDPITIQMTVVSLTTDGPIEVDGFWVYSEPAGTVVSFTDQTSGDVSESTTLPATLTGLAPQSLGRYHHPLLYLKTFYFPSSATFATIEVAWVISSGTPEPPGGGENGIYVGRIVLADPVTGIWRYSESDQPCETGPDAYADISPNTTWSGTRDGLAPSTGGFTLRRVRATEAGTYPWVCTPRFAIANDTTRISIFLYDGVGDFQDVLVTRYVTSGETIFGYVYIPTGFSVAFVAGDDAAPDGQAVLASSFWNFPA